MARCQDCNKFVGYEGDEEPEESDTPSLDEDGNFNFQVRIMKNCAECGTELKESYLDFEGQVDEEWWLGQMRAIYEKENGPAESGMDIPNDASNFEISIENLAALDQPGSRYAKAFYGATCEVVVTSPTGEEWREECEQKIQASFLDDV